MKRKIIVFIAVSIFNIVIIEGIDYANKIMFMNNFLIKLTSSPLPKTDQGEQPIVDVEYNGESDVGIGKKIEKYLKDTELEGYGNYIAKTSITKKVNPYLIGGIILENTNCAVDCSIILKNCNNVGDMKGNPGCFGGSYKKYDSIEESINDLVIYIYDKFYFNNLETPSQICQKYGKDLSWAFKVSRYMEDIKKTK